LPGDDQLLIERDLTVKHYEAADTIEEQRILADETGTQSRAPA